MSCYLYQKKKKKKNLNCSEFLFRNHGGKKALEYYFSSAKIKKTPNCQPQILFPAKIYFKDEREMKTMSDNEKQRQTYPKSMAKGNSQNRKKTREGVLEHSEGENMISKNVDKYDRLVISS